MQKFPRGMRHGEMWDGGENYKPAVCRDTGLLARCTQHPGRPRTLAVEICDLEQFYYASTAPLIVKSHVIAGVSGDDLDIPRLHPGT
jgi:hypothetical protein